MIDTSAREPQMNLALAASMLVAVCCRRWRCGHHLIASSVQPLPKPRFVRGTQQSLSCG